MSSLATGATLAQRADSYLALAKFFADKVVFHRRGRHGLRCALLCGGRSGRVRCGDDLRIHSKSMMMEGCSVKIDGATSWNGLSTP